MNPAVIGAGVCTLLGAVWFALGGIFGGLTYTPQLLIPVASVFIVLVVLIARTNRAPTPRARSRFAPGSSRAFGIISGLEFVAILVAAGIATQFRREDLVPALIELIVGLHFLPLARVFGARTHFFVGVSMVAGSAVAFAQHGPEAVAVACVSAGAILWIAAITTTVRSGARAFK